MSLRTDLVAAVRTLPVPPSPAAYFQGARRKYSCSPDDILVFSRLSAQDLRRRSAESHLHRRFVLVVCLETGGTLSMDGVPFELRPGQAHLVFPQSYHYFLDLAAPEIAWFMVTFESAEPQRLSPLRQRTVTLTHDDLAALHELVDLFSGNEREEQGDKLSITLSHLLSRLCQEAAAIQPSQDVSTPRAFTGLWKRLPEELEALPPEQLQVTPLAKRLRISERHLRAKFREEFGVSLGTYLRNYRLRRATGLLSTSTLSIAEIADRCGYQSAPAFHRAFQREIGQTPGEFRRDLASSGL